MAQIAEDLGVGPDRIKVIPNGVDLEQFRPANRLAARRELGLPVDARLIVTVAHLGQRKGHHETIATLRSLPQDVRLVLVGGPGPLGGDGGELKQRATSFGVADRLILAGKQPHDRVPKFYQAADLTVLASWREGCPNTVIESLACGTPVVATDVGAVRWMIDEVQNGRVVPLRDVEGLTRAIQNMLDQSPSAEIVCASANVQSWDHVAREVLQTFYSALNVQKRPPIGDRSPAGCTRELVK
jgi:glycosyltransferase involved in cell wall biosynthesis